MSIFDHFDFHVLPWMANINIHHDHPPPHHHDPPSLSFHFSSPPFLSTNPKKVKNQPPEYHPRNQTYAHQRGPIRPTQPSVVEGPR